MTTPLTKNINGVSVEYTPKEEAAVRARWAAAIQLRASQADAKLEKSIVDQTQKRLDDFAATRGYDGIKSAAGYAGCSVEKFSAEGTYCRDKQAETYAALYALLDQVNAGNWPTAGAGQKPTGYADVEPSLPALQWPA